MPPGGPEPQPPPRPGRSAGRGGGFRASPPNAAASASAPPPPGMSLFGGVHSGGGGVSARPPPAVVTPATLWAELEPFVRGMEREQVELVARGLRVAYEAHDGQTRKSGEPYIIHPVEARGARDDDDALSHPSLARPRQPVFADCVKRGPSPSLSSPTLWAQVARMLAELGMDHETVIAGLLHDTVEDTTRVTFERIEVSSLHFLLLRGWKGEGREVSTRVDVVV